MYRCENQTIKKAEYQRIDSFVCGAGEDSIISWTARRSNRSALKKISPEYLLEELMLKQKLQYFSHLMGRTDSLKKTLMLRKTEGRRRRGWQRMRWLNGITDSMDMSLSKLWEIVKDRGAWRALVHRVRKNQTWLSNWTTITIDTQHCKRLRWFDRHGYCEMMVMVKIFICKCPLVHLVHSQCWVATTPPSTKHFHHNKRKPCTHWAVTVQMSTTTNRQPWAPTSLLSVSLYLVIYFSSLIAMHGELPDQGLNLYSL